MTVEGQPLEEAAEEEEGVHETGQTPRRRQCTSPEVATPLVPDGIDELHTQEELCQHHNLGISRFCLSN